MSGESSNGSRHECVTLCDYPQKTRTALKQILVILPAYNEEISIGSMVHLTRSYADKVIVVDDGSLDRTADVARKAGAEVIVHEVNLGKGRALKTGFETALTWVLT
ncbi:glycosyltransferase family 2 protein [Methanosarcina barkeri]|uniref:glycosyltransferase family 2 protein n=1 Tax=Methanosarcina barkeri TaxID=2208 RepID=UPI000A4EC372|nr:glycosyltransferase family 2 protein [Methanosarcina barkeri]